MSLENFAYPILNIHFACRPPYEDDWLPEFLAQPYCTPFQAACAIEGLQAGAELKDKKTIIYAVHDNYDIDNWIKENDAGIIDRISRKTWLFSIWFGTPEISPTEAIAKALRENISVDMKVVGMAMQAIINKHNNHDSSKLKLEIKSLSSQLELAQKSIDLTNEKYSSLELAYNKLKEMAPEKSNQGINSIRKRELVLAQAIYQLSKNRDDCTSTKGSVIGVRLADLVISAFDENCGAPLSHNTIERAIQAALKNGSTLQEDNAKESKTADRTSVNAD